MKPVIKLTFNFKFQQKVELHILHDWSNRIVINPINSNSKTLDIAIGQSTFCSTVIFFINLRFHDILYYDPTFNAVSHILPSLPLGPKPTTSPLKSYEILQSVE